MLWFLEDDVVGHKENIQVQKFPLVAIQFQRLAIHYYIENVKFTFLSLKTCAFGPISVVLKVVQNQGALSLSHNISLIGLKKTNSTTTYKTVNKLVPGGKTETDSGLMLDHVNDPHLPRDTNGIQ